MGKRIPRWFERLERREMCAADWQNATNRLDVNSSGMVEPLDALIVINYINEHGTGAMESKPTNYSGALMDVNGDGSMSPLDALIVINSLNRVDVGSAAPVVRLPNQDGEMVDLSSFIGKQIGRAHV